MGHSDKMLSHVALDIVERLTPVGMSVALVQRTLFPPGKMSRQEPLLLSCRAVGRIMATFKV